MTDKKRCCSRCACSVLSAHLTRTQDRNALTVKKRDTLSGRIDLLLLEAGQRVDVHEQSPTP